MNANKFAVGLCGLAIWTSAPAYGQQATIAPNDDPKRVLVGRLDLERYKATLRGLGQYGDRQQGTDRNRAAVDWIEAQLRSYGCAPERIKYVYNSPGLPRDREIVPHPPGTPVASGEIVMGLGGARIRGMTLPVVPNNNPAAQTDPILRALNEGPSTPGHAGARRRIHAPRGRSGRDRTLVAVLCPSGRRCATAPVIAADPSDSPCAA